MEKKHSGLGIASFIVSLLAGIVLFLLVIAAGIMEISTPGGMDEQSAEVVIIGLSIIVLLFVDLVALGLGIAGLLQTDKKIIFSVLGTIFSSTTIAGMILLIIVGNMMA